MKKILYTFLLFSPLFFFNACEEEAEEAEEVSCTGNSTADMLVGTWEANYRAIYYPNGDAFSCTNYCNTYNSLCEDADCITVFYNCDGTATNSAGDEGTWSYDPQTETITSISGSLGVVNSTIETLTTNQLITTTNMILVDQESGAQIDLVVQSAATRIN